MHCSRKFKIALLALVALAAVIVPARAWDDYLDNVSVTPPKGWVALPNASLPAHMTFRNGWTSPDWVSNKNTYGGSIILFVQDTQGNSAKSLLEKNVALIKGVKFGDKPEQQTDINKAAKLRVVKQQLIKLGGYEGFVLEVDGIGTGFSIGLPVATPKNVGVRLVPTRQRWFCVVRRNMMIGLLSTAADSVYARFFPSFRATESSLKIREGLK
jgi:hypothetical protein